MNKVNINWQVLPFDNLTSRNVYDMLSLRSEIFVVEQQQAYQDVDYRDLDCLHVLGYTDDNELVAHCRVFPCGKYYTDGCIGRVVVKPSFRGTGLGHELIDKGIETHYALNGEDKSVSISAQFRLRAYYESHGFERASTIYSEDNIPHMKMTRKGLK